MPPAKKLQVFVSSTYTDLREERQAAVEAILSSGHIPAGMELFAAGDESQMSVIRRWIDESDVFLLILGGRYGSLEQLSGKSYTHLEYEYATERGKPLFAVVINENALEERVKSAGTSVIEIEHSARLREFRQTVLSKMVRFWSDVRDIKLAIHETMGEFSRRSDLKGWVPGDQAVSGSLLAEEIARLTKENAELRAQLADSAGAGVMTYNGLTFEQMIALLNEPVDLDSIGSGFSIRWIKAAAEEFGHADPTLLHVLWGLRERLSAGGWILVNDWQYPFLARLAFLGFLDLQLEHALSERYKFELTPDGKKFFLRLLTMRVESGALGVGASNVDPARPGSAA